MHVLNCSQGLSAILSPNTGILDWAEVAKSYGADFKKAGGDIYPGFEVRILQKSTPASNHKCTAQNLYPISDQNGKNHTCLF